MLPRQFVETIEDKTMPIICAHTNDAVNPLVQESNDTFNRYVLTDREIHGKRTKIRVAFEVYGRAKRGELSFVRLRQRHVVLSIPTAEQAELAIDIIRQVCASMEGKHLVRSPKP